MRALSDTTHTRYWQLKTALTRRSVTKRAQNVVNMKRLRQERGLFDARWACLCAGRRLIYGTTRPSKVGREADLNTVA